MSDNSSAAGGAGLVLSLVAGGRARSRAELVTATGFSRTTVAQYISQLLSAGLLAEGTETARSGGRPSRLLQVNKDFAVVLAADLGETHARLAVTDLSPAIITERTIEIDLHDGPIVVLAAIAKQFAHLLAETGLETASVLGIGLGLPAPVDHLAGRVVGPSVMTGWDDFDICDCLTAQTNVPVLVENDVNLMTLSELRVAWPDVAQLLFIKAGTGIGSGIIADGRLYRGAQGAAGDIGHIQLDGHDPPLCRCGKRGCLEAHAAGWAIARDLRNQGIAAQGAQDVLSLVGKDQEEAVRLVRAAGLVLGEVAASVVSVLNPSVIVVGGTLAEAGEILLSGVRERVHRRSLPLAIRQLRIVKATGGKDAGVLGAAHLVIDARLQAKHADETIASYTHASASRTVPAGGASDRTDVSRRGVSGKSRDRPPDRRLRII